MSEEEEDRGLYEPQEGEFTEGEEERVLEGFGKPKVTDVPFVKKEIEAAPKADDAERYKKILVDLGFHKKQNGDDKVQYVKKEGEIVIGRTFSEKTPTGMFWALGNNKFLDPPVVKELKIVRAFYAIREGNKTIEDVMNELGIKEDKAVIPFGKGGAIERKIGTIQWEKKGGFYPVRGHNEADAWLVQQWGNEMGFSTKIITAEQDDKGVKVIVRAEKDGQFVEAVVIHDFKTSSEVIAFETIEIMEREHKKAIDGYDDDGRPILVPEAKYRIYKRFIKFKNFAARDATTKAARIATLKILNRDWREAEEIDAEAAEVRAVNER